MMLFSYSAKFNARVCQECLIHFSNVKVSLYRGQEKECSTEPNIKRAFKELSAEEFKGMQSHLLAEGRTDNKGNIELLLDSRKNEYQGECIEVVISLDKLPSSEESLEEREHFRMASYQPAWQERENGLFHFSELIIPIAYWCTYLQRHKIWVICGQVTTCDKPMSPIGNVTVKAYDVDWTQDDHLGSDLTDSNGWFVIYYDMSKFNRTPFSPFINTEWTGGPDVYFKIEGVDSDGNTVLLLDEPHSRGRKADRENVSNCFCTKLCVDLMPQINPNEVPMWTHIGNYQIPDSVNMHDFSTEGYTNTNSLAFYSTMDLIGQTGKATAGKKLRYRFLYAQWMNGTAPTPVMPVIANMISPTKVGQIIVSLSPLVLEPVYVNHPSATHNHQPDSDGWIAVEENPMFTPVTNKLISLNSIKLAPYASYSNPAPNPDAGNPAPIDSARTEHKFAIAYELEEDIGSGWVSVHSQTMDALIINNARVFLGLELDEFILNSNLCQPIKNTVTVKYTADHPHLDWYEVEIEKQGSNMHWAIPRVHYGGSLTFRGGEGTTGAIDISIWDACSYIVFLRANRRVTNGYGSPSSEYTYRTFCKS